VAVSAGADDGVSDGIDVGAAGLEGGDGSGPQLLAPQVTRTTNINRDIDLFILASLLFSHI
jgi:hypothetical protein